MLSRSTNRSPTSCDYIFAQVDSADSERHLKGFRDQVAAEGATQHNHCFLGLRDLLRRLDRVLHLRVLQRVHTQYKRRITETALLLLGPAYRYVFLRLDVQYHSHPCALLHPFPELHIDRQLVCKGD